MTKNFVELINELAKQKFERIEFLLRSARAWTEISDLPNIRENWDKKDKGEEKAMVIIDELMDRIAEIGVITQGLDIYTIAKKKGIQVNIEEIKDDEQHNDNEEELFLMQDDAIGNFYECYDLATETCCYSVARALDWTQLAATFD